MVPRWKQYFGHRTQWLKRLVKLSDAHQLTVQLACHPPYHSKYNPVAKNVMLDIEARLERTAGLEDWFIKIVPHPQTG